MSMAGEIIDLELLQSQPIETWDGDVSSCSGRQARRLGNKGAGSSAGLEKMQSFALEFLGNRRISRKNTTTTKLVSC